MDLDYSALIHCCTCDLIPHPTSAKVMIYAWIFTLKYHPNDIVARYKAELIARGFTRARGIYYTKTFSPVVCMNIIRVLLSLVINLDWSIHQLDASNTFIHCDLV